jgi:transcriptional regulator with XRE-family HTH domain
MATEPPGVQIAGGLVRTLRKRSGDNLVTFAPKAGISVQYLSLIELGRRPTVSPKVFGQICDALNVTNRDDLIDKVAA